MRWLAGCSFVGVAAVSVGVVAAWCGQVGLVAAACGVTVLSVVGIVAGLLLHVISVVRGWGVE